MADNADGYIGPATLHVDGQDLAAHVQLDARHEPHDGRLHWFGRLRFDPEVPVPPGFGAASADVAVTTPGGRAVARIGERDPWGRYRVTGVGAPPYTLGDPTFDD